MTSISERLTLFALDNSDRTLTETANLRLGFGLAGALLLDLILEGALQVEPGGELRPNAAKTFKRPYLSAAFAALPSYATLEQGDAFKALYNIMPQLKQKVLEALAKNGALKTGKSKLKWSFALKVYTLKANKAGYRKKLATALLQNKIQLSDYWVLQLAASSGLLGGKGIDKKDQAQLTAKLRSVSGGIGLVEGIAARVADHIPGALAASDPPLKTQEKPAVIWEWRGFWQDTKGPTFLRTSQAYKQSLENLAFEETMDTYLVIEGVPENIKCRKNALEIKRPLESIDGYTAFSPKETWPFPLSAAQVEKLFARVTAKQARKLENVEELQALLSEAGYRAQRVETRKKRFLVKLKNQVRVEFCSLSIGGKKYLSTCVEGANYDITHAHALHFQKPNTLVMGYVEFLKHTLLEPAL